MNMHTDECNGEIERTMGKDMMKPVYRPEGASGFTLIENIIAMFLVVVAIVGLISTSIIVIKANSLGKTMTTATTLAQDKMEALKNTGYSSMASGTDTVQSLFTRTWTVTGDSPAANMKTIVVSVAWSLQGSPHDVTIRCIASSGT